MFSDFSNFPSPVVAISEDGFLVGKNYLADLSFDVLHVGAKINRYTDIDYTKESISSGEFCGKKCTFISYFDKLDDKSVTLLFISFAIAEGDLPFKLFDAYKEKLLSYESNESTYKERKYARAINSNLIKSNFFSYFMGLMNDVINRKRLTEKNDTVILSQICSTIGTAVSNYLEELKISVETEYISPSMIANIRESDLMVIILNTLSFCAINTSDEIKMRLSKNDSSAELCFSFKASAVFDSILAPNDNKMLNSSFMLFSAFELAKMYDIECCLSRRQENKLSEYELIYKIPVRTDNGLLFSGSDRTTVLADKLLRCIFFNENTI